MATGWVYEDRPLNGGAGGEAFRIVFNGAGIEPAAMLAREAIQNSVDAAAEPGGEVEVRFEARTLEGEDRARFEEAAGFGDIARRADRLKLPAGDALRSAGGPLRLLYVSDRGTTGLAGDPSGEGSKLRKLLMEIGGSRKTEDEHTGGSYGFGKAVYGGSSRIATIFAYSRTTDHHGRPISVLMGCAYHPGHEFEGRSTTGRGFLGRSTTVRGKGVRYDPFVGKEADGLAGALGMARDADDVGTTVLIVDTTIELDAIRHGVEEYWWPRLERGLLQVDLVDADGQEHHARPRSRDDLKPFVDALDVVLQKSPPRPGKSWRRTFNKFGPRNLGTIGLVVMPDGEEVEDDDVPERKDTVALIRSPQMVVRYYGKRSVGDPAIAGVFVAHEDIDDILRRSEPPKHDEWAESAQRLDEVPDGRDVVKTVLKRTWAELKRVQKDARPPEAAKPKRLMQLERTLAAWFGPSAARPSPSVQADAAPVSIRPRVDAEDVGGRLRMRGSVAVALAKGAEMDELAVRIDLSCLVREEDGVSTKDPIDVHVEGDTDLERVDGGWLGRLTRDAPLELSVVSDPYDPAWAVRFVPQVTPFERGRSS